MTVSQRDRLLGRALPSTTYRLVVDADAVGPAAKARDAADQALGRARLSTAKTRAAAVRRAEKALADAQAAVDACYETIRLQAMPPELLEALVAVHPPTPAQLAASREERDRAVRAGEPPDPAPSWDDDTFRPALLAACAPESGMSAGDWAAFLASNVSQGEKADLWMAVLEVNQRTRIADPVVLPKELMQILNSRSSLMSARTTLFRTPGS